MRSSQRLRFSAALIAAWWLNGCATVPLAEQAMGRPLPVATDASSSDVAEIVFTADPQYQSVAGTPIQGDPLICTQDGAFRVNGAEQRKDRVAVQAGEPVTVTSVVRWVSSYWEKTCWPRLSFTPAAGKTYVVVNERMGTKGAAALWRGPAFQHCEVSVYVLNQQGRERVPPQSGLRNLCSN